MMVKAIRPLVWARKPLHGLNSICARQRRLSECIFEHCKHGMGAKQYDLKSQRSKRQKAKPGKRRVRTERSTLVFIRRTFAIGCDNPSVCPFPITILGRVIGPRFANVLIHQRNVCEIGRRRVRSAVVALHEACTPQIVDIFDLVPAENLLQLTLLVSVFGQSVDVQFQSRTRESSQRPYWLQT